MRSCRPFWSRLAGAGSRIDSAIKHRLHTHMRFVTTDRDDRHRAIEGGDEIVAKRFARDVALKPSHRARVTYVGTEIRSVLIRPCHEPDGNVTRGRFEWQDDEIIWLDAVHEVPDLTRVVANCTFANTRKNGPIFGNEFVSRQGCETRQLKVFDNRHTIFKGDAFLHTLVPRANNPNRHARPFSTVESACYRYHQRRLPQSGQFHGHCTHPWEGQCNKRQTSCQRLSCLWIEQRPGRCARSTIG